MAQSQWLVTLGRGPPCHSLDVTPLGAFLMRAKQPRPGKSFTGGGNELLKGYLKSLVQGFVNGVLHLHHARMTPSSPQLNQE